jgi:RimJ/RimL family protein N-acetyltransferase
MTSSENPDKITNARGRKLVQFFENKSRGENTFNICSTFCSDANLHYSSVNHLEWILQTKSLQTTPLKIHFESLNAGHLSLLHKWLNEPHVVERWHSDATIDEVKEQYFTLDGDDAVDRWIAEIDGVETAYVQRYWAARSGDGWWEDQRDAGTVGIDFFIGPADKLDQGLGTKIIRAFTEMLMGDSKVTKIISDPAPTNLRSIRCLEKAGFTRVGQIITPDGPAMLMELRY